MNLTLRFSKPILVVSVLLIHSWLMAGDFANSRFNHRIVSFNPGYTFTGSGDSWGVSNEFTHFKSITSWLFHKESIEGWLINGRSWHDNGFENQTGVNIGVDVGIVPFKSGERIFYLTGGGILAYFSNIAPNLSFHYPITHNGVTKTLSLIHYGAENYITPGFALSAGYITKVNDKIYLNIRAQVEVYNAGETISTLSVGIGLNALKK
jgi:hypothetical protein